MPTFVQILDFTDTFTFVISDIRLASVRRFDWLGAHVIGFVAAIGDGTVHDPLLDVTPGWMTDPIYLTYIGLALLWIIFSGEHLIRLHNAFFIFGTIDLALLMVMGVGKSLPLGYLFWVATIIGNVTGAMGGTICDVFINETPPIFRKKIYAMACVVGGAIYQICELVGMHPYGCQVIGGVSVFTTRILAIEYKVYLPVLSGNDGEEEEEESWFLDVFPGACVCL